jgi:hypothetical protein
MKVILWHSVTESIPCTLKDLSDTHNARAEHPFINSQMIFRQRRQWPCRQRGLSRRPGRGPKQWPTKRAAKKTSYKEWLHDGGAKRQHLANFVAIDALKIDDCRQGAILWLVEAGATRAAHAGDDGGIASLVPKAKEPLREAGLNPAPRVPPVRAGDENTKKGQIDSCKRKSR